LYWCQGGAVLPNEKNYTILMTLKNNFHILKSHAPELEHKKQLNRQKYKTIEHLADALFFETGVVDLKTYG
jgi:hypothetical protein